jgi:hypothetical protein
MKLVIGGGMDPVHMIMQQLDSRRVKLVGPVFFKNSVERS